jgi:hypothetical protein
MDVEFRFFLTTALDGAEGSSSRYGRFTLREKVPVVFEMSPRAGLDGLVKRNIFVLELSAVACKELNCDLGVCSL